MQKVRDNYYREIRREQSSILIEMTAILFWVLMLIGSLITAIHWGQNPNDHRQYLMWFGSFLLFLFLIWTLIDVFYGRNIRLVVDKTLITKQGYFSFNQIDLHEIQSVHWSTSFTQGPILISEKGKIRINLQNFSLNNRRHLILYFRRHVPEEIQTNWEQFVNIYGLKTLNSSAPKPKEQKKQLARDESEGLTQINQKQTLKAVLALGSLLTLVGGVLAILLNHHKLWAAGVPVFVYGGVVWSKMYFSPKPTTLTVSKGGKFWFVLVISIIVVLSYQGILFWFKLQFPVIQGNIGFCFFLLSLLPYLGILLYWKKKNGPRLKRMKQNREDLWKEIQARYGI